ncbi:MULTISPECIES: hypothetical protein [unclassified Synechococcus]|uniref:hypothetical protein n=1 Tax=unclassified Synechococcus TaxID=2626047 RepID=UPI001483CC7F|nr:MULTISPECIES: hypothetical protein [unclassified Synechococcus]
MKASSAVLGLVVVEGIAGAQQSHPGGGVHEFQFFNSGSADRGERRLTAQSSD